MNKHQKRGALLLLLGLVMVLIALGMHYAQERQDDIAGQNAQILLEHLQLNKTPVILPSGDEAGETDTPEETQPVDTTMAVKDYLGYSMIGTLRISSVGIELPIMSSWSYDLLNVAPCRYYGSIGGGDLTILGHNYRSHFTPLHQIQVGAEVEFEDVNGVKYHYVVSAIEYLHKSEGEKLPSEHALTLITCTAGGQNRLIVRCDPA